VIVDAPATGHGVGILKTPRTFSDIARVGPIKRQAETINGFMTDPKLTSVCAVAWPEEMPVNETIDLRKNLKRELGLDLDQVFMNGIYPQLFTDEEAAIVEEQVEREAGANGPGAAVVRRGALRAAVSEHRRATSHREQLARLEEGLGKDAVELPFVFRPQLDMGAVELLADRIEESL
jgi:anion-transporting  ArsA/GET3 family ATPase